MSSKRKPYARDKSQRIRKVVEAAVKIIEEKSYEDLSMNALHKLTKIPIGTLYKDFPDGKEDILLEILMQYKDDFEDKYIEFDEKRLREYVFHALDVGMQRRKFLIALQMESLKSPESFLLKARKSISDISIDVFKKVVDYIAGRPLSLNEVIEMLTVWKAVVRQHIIFGSLYGSHEKFLDMIVRIIRGLAG